MRTIYKYALPDPNRTGKVLVPRSAKFVHADAMQEGFFLWFEVDTEETVFDERYFIIFGTGHVLPDNGWHMKTVLCGPFVWHIYEVHDARS